MIANGTYSAYIKANEKRKQAYLAELKVSDPKAYEVIAKKRRALEAKRRKKMRADPVRYAAYKEKAKQWWQDIKDNEPERYEAILVRERARYHENMKDPVAREKERKRKAASARKYRKK
jgi:hypothetical protein